MSKSNRLKRLLALLTFAASITMPLMATGDDAIPPTDKDKLFEWLSARQYEDWPHESKPHRSAGPHPVQVIAYLNPKLDESLASGNALHPTGSAAVKELLNASGELAGWAVSVKTQADSDTGKGWFWYEILGTSPDSRIVAAQNGVPLCFGCHLPGKDFVLIPHPLK